MTGPPPDRFLVGLAALTLLTDAAAERPVLCLVDDAQWLDQVSVEVLGFVARRLYADRVGMLLSVREGEERAAALADLPELTVGGLRRGSARAAGDVVGRAGGRAGERRIVADTAGNPLALVELAGELTAAELSGAEPLDWPLRFGGRLEELYRSQVRACRRHQTLLLLAAADPTGEPALIWNAARNLGIDPEAGRCGMERLMSWEPRVRFRHPLIRSAAYYAALAAARRRAHEALAAVTDPERDPDRRAWHLAEAAAGPDEQVAAELERSADRARGRGGWASGAAFLERAAALTPDDDHRARRMLAAAEDRLVAGEAPAARALLGLAVPRLADALARARARRLEGRSLYAAGQMPEATSVLLDAARMLQPFDARLARDTLLDAFSAAQFSGQPGAGMAEFVHAVRSAPKVADSQATVADLLLDGFAAVGERRYDAGAAFLRRAIAPLASDQPIPDDATPYVTAIALAAILLYDDSPGTSWRSDGWWSCVTGARLRPCWSALGVQLGVQVEEGRFADAEATLAEARALSEATGYRAYLNAYARVELWALARRGQEADARAARRPAAARVRRAAQRVRGAESARCAGPARAGPGQLRRRAAPRAGGSPRAGRTGIRSGRGGGRGRNQVRRARDRDCGPGGLHALGAGEPGPTWPWGCWLAAGRCWPTTTRPRRSTGWPSSTCGAAGWSRSWPGRTWCTGNGCAASAAAATPATSSAAPSTCSTRWA